MTTQTKQQCPRKPRVYTGISIRIQTVKEAVMLIDALTRCEESLADFLAPREASLFARRLAECRRELRKRSGITCLPRNRTRGIAGLSKKKRAKPLGAPAADCDPRYLAALARGDLTIKLLAVDEGGAISIAAVARLLQIAQSSVVKRWRSYRLVAWGTGKTLQFPVWQFDGRHLLAGIEDLLKIFRSRDQWRVMQYFLCRRLSLSHRRPLDLLREGKAADVIQHAQRYAAENLW